MVKESDVSVQLTQFQKLPLDEASTETRQRMHYIGPSFEAMVCTEINAAAVEYIPKPDSCAYITSDTMLMVDAGANYKSPCIGSDLRIETGQRTLLELSILVDLQI